MSPSPEKASLPGRTLGSWVGYSLCRYQQALGSEPLCCHMHVCMFNIPGDSAASAELLAWAVQVISLGTNYSLG